MAVASPTPAGPKRSKAIEVIIADKEIFTMLFPTRIVFNSFSFLSKSFPARIAFLFFLFLKSLNLNLFIERKAVSEAEKIIESKIRTTAKISSPVIDDESDSIFIRHPQLHYFLLFHLLQQKP